MHALLYWFKSHWLLVESTVVALIWAYAIPSILHTIYYIKWIKNVRERGEVWSREFDEIIKAHKIPNRADLDSHYSQMAKDIDNKNPLYWKRNWDKPYPSPGVERAFDWSFIESEGWPRSGGNAK